MPSRRDRTKAEATRTPLADLAPSVPERAADSGTDEPQVTPVIADDDMMAESTATMPAPLPETDTAPANARSRPGARKIGDRSGVPVVPRTIAEMQAGTHHILAYDVDSVAEEMELEREREAPPLFIGVRALIVTTVVPYAVLALVPAIMFALCRATHRSAPVSFVVFFVAIAVCSVIALALLLRNWRAAFHEAPEELRPSSILMLWETRARGQGADGWKTGSLAIIAIFLLLFILNLVSIVLRGGIAATYLVPFQLLLIASKVIGTFLFYGYLQRGLASVMSEGRAAGIAGIALGASAALTSSITYAAGAGASAQSVLTFVGIVIVVSLIGAWIGMRSRVVYAGIAFYLLLLGFSSY